MRIQTLALAIVASAWFAACPAHAAKESGAKGKARTAAYVTDVKATNKARGYLKKWPARLRDAHIALFHSLFFEKDGSSPYVGGGKPGVNKPKTISDHAQFIATDGNMYGLMATLWDASPEEEQEMMFVMETKEKCGADAVLASYSKEVKMMKQYFDQRNKDGKGAQEGDNLEKDNPQEDNQREDVQEERSQKGQAKDFKDITKKIQHDIAGEARTALVACLLKEVPVQKALQHSYTNSKGEQCFVYEQLLHEGCLEAVLEVLDKTSKSPATGQKVLAKFEKKRESLEKGEKLRALHMHALQKQYEVYEAEAKSQMPGDSGESNVQNGLDAAAGIIEQAKEPLGRTALLQVATRKLNVKQLFCETVLDSQQAPHSCYDVLNNAGMLEQAFKVMMNVAESPGVADGLASRYPDECEAQEKGREKREKNIRLALKQYEAKALQNDIRELEKE